MKMIKKIFFFFTMLLITNCGYDAMYSKKKINSYSFSIEKINYLGDRDINVQLKESLSGYIQKKANRSFDLEINSISSKNILARDSKGDPLIFENNTSIEILVYDSGIYKDKLQFSQNFEYNNTINKFLLKQYEKEIKIGVAESIANELVLAITNIK